LTTALFDNYEPAWSSDGLSMAYTSFRGANRDIFSIGIGGGAETNLTNNGALDNMSDFLPVCTVLGTSGADTLVGTSGADLLCGLGGSDTMQGAGGNDVVFGGAGKDVVRGGAGDDVVNGGTQVDSIFGGDDNDQLNGRDGAPGDSLSGGTGTDACLKDSGDTNDTCP